MPQYIITDPFNYRREITCDVEELAHMTLAQTAKDRPGLPFTLRELHDRYASTKVETIVYIEGANYTLALDSKQDGVGDKTLFHAPDYHTIMHFAEKFLRDHENSFPLQICLVIHYGDDPRPLVVLQNGMSGEHFPSEILRYLAP